MVEPGDGLRQVRASEAKAHVLRLLIDGAGQEQHAGPFCDLLAPSLEIELAGDARKADRPGGRAGLRLSYEGRCC